MPPPAEAPSFRDTVVFETSLVRVGAFRCDADHPAFRHSDPIQNHCVWFSRTPVVIQPERERAFVANGHIAVFYNRAQSFGRVRVDTDGDYSDWFAIDEAAAYDILDACAPNIHPRDHPFPWSYVRVNAQTYLQQRRLFEAATSGSPQDRLAIEEGTIRLVHQLVAKALAADARSRSTVIRPRHRDLVHETERLLSRTCEESISLTALAKQVGSSVYHLCRVFRRITGMTMHQYRQRLRLRMTLEAVTERRATITDIAARGGFPSHSHFTCAFRREFGLLPSVLRHTAVLACKDNCAARARVV
jgi:AraC-like DNA-binding protein